MLRSVGGRDKPGHDAYGKIFVLETNRVYQAVLFTI